MIKFLKYNLQGISWGIVIILLSVIPGKVFPKLPEFADLFQPDKIIHLLVFGIYCYLQIRGIRKCGHLPWLRDHAVQVVMVAGLLLGAGTELIQHYLIPMRRGSVFDFIANMAGCGCGYWFARKWL